jgi:hypothetical protein
VANDLQYVGSMTHSGAFVLGVLLGVFVVLRVFDVVRRNKD